MINHYDYNALFLETINAHIDELILEDIAVTGKIDNFKFITKYSASLVGYAENTYISNVHVNGVVSKGKYVVGIVGYARF